MSDPGHLIDKLRTRIENSDEILDRDREALLAFSDEMYLLKTRYSDYRHEKLLRHCTRIAEETECLAAALTDRDATESIVRWINRTYENEETNRDYRVALRVFGRRTSDENGDEPPDAIEWVPSGTSRNYDPAPEPRDMLRWEEDIQPMIEATKNSRDAALITVAWDSGARSGEIRSLAVGDVTDHQHGLQITVNGKMGKRTVTLIPSVPYLQRWLQDHPDSNDSTAPLWCKLHAPESMSYNAKIPSIAKPAGISTPIQARWEAIIGSQTANDTPKVRMTNAVTRRIITAASFSVELSFNTIWYRFRRGTSGFDRSPGPSRLARGSDARR